MSDISREFTVRRGQMTRLPFGSFGGMSAIPARDGQPAKAKVSITLPGGEGESRILSLGATLTLPNGTWMVAEINGAGTSRWAVRFRRVD